MNSIVDGGNDAYDHGNYLKINGEIAVYKFGHTVSGVIGDVVYEHDIAGRLAHFASIEQQMFGVHPVANDVGSRHRIALRSFVFVVTVGEVRANGCDSKPGAVEARLRDQRCLDERV